MTRPGPCLFRGETLSGSPEQLGWGRGRPERTKDSSAGQGLLPILCKPLPLDVEACSPKAAANTHTHRLRDTFREHFLLHWVRESFRECGAFSLQEKRSWSSGQPWGTAVGFRSCLGRVGGGLQDLRRLSWTPDSEPHPGECSEETQVEGTEESSRGKSGCSHSNQGPKRWGNP